jgi:hypothetical protein
MNQEIETTRIVIALHDRLELQFMESKKSFDGNSKAVQTFSCRFAHQIVWFRYLPVFWFLRYHADPISSTLISKSPASKTASRGMISHGKPAEVS